MISVGKYPEPDQEWEPDPEPDLIQKMKVGQFKMTSRHKQDIVAFSYVAARINSS